VHAIFSKFDTDGTTSLSVTELRASLKATSIELSEAQLDEMFKAADADGSESLDRREFEDLMVRVGLWNATA
jgi:Ca2+-binding EF-hand superfamily protein